MTVLPTARHGQKLGGSGVGAESGVDARQVAAMAALQRHADGGTNRTALRIGWSNRSQ